MATDITFDVIARDKASQTFSKIAGSSEKSHKVLAKFGKAAAIGAAAVGALGIAATVFTVKAGKGYVDSLNKIQALGDLTNKQTSKVASALEAQAGQYAKLGQTTGDAASGMVELVKAGLSVDQALKAVNATMTLAKAGELSVADAASLVSNTLNAFHLKAQKAGDVANYLANAANASSSDVADLGEALKYVGPVAAASRVSLKQTTAILAELSNSSIGSTNAGTGFRKFLLSLQAPAGAASKDLKALGVTIFDAGGKMKPLGSIIDQLGTKLSGLSDEKRQKIMKDIFGLQGISAAQVILDGGVKGLDKYSKAVDKAGAAQKLAEAASKGLGGTILMLRSDFTSLAQTAYRKLSPLANAVLLPIASGFGHISDKAGPALDGFVTALSKVDVSGFTNKVKAGFDKLDLPDLGPKLKQQASAWAGPVIDGFNTGLNTGDWSGLGEAVGNGLVKAVSAAGSMSGKLLDALDKVFKKIDWIGLGITLGKEAPALVLGLATGILNFDIGGALKGIGKHWFEIVLGIVAIAFTPGRVVGKIAEILSRVPIIGPFLRWALLGTKKLGDALVSGVWKALKFMGRGFLEGFRRVFPEAGKALTEGLRLLPTRIGVAALDLVQAAGRMMTGLGRAIARGITAVVAKFGELSGRILKPFADAGGWLVGKGRTIVVGLARGIGRGVSLVLHAMAQVTRMVVAPWADAGRWLVSKGRAVIAGLAKGISGAAHVVIGAIKAIPWRILSALGDLGSLLVDAGRSVISGFFSGLKSQWKAVAGWVSSRASWIADHKGPIAKDKILLKPAGIAIMEGLLSGLKSRQPKLATVLDKITDYIAKQADKVAALMSSKRDVIASFKGLAGSAFGATFTDAEGNDSAGSVGDILKYQQQQLAKARMVQADVKALVSKGLSKALIQQMIDAGDSGLANLHTLAGGSAGDIKSLNALDKATSAAYGSAGNLVGNALYGKDIRLAQEHEDLAKAIARQLRAVLKEQGKDEYVVQLGADAIIRIIRKRAKEKGVTVAQLLAGGS